MSCVCYNELQQKAAGGSKNCRGNWTELKAANAAQHKSAAAQSNAPIWQRQLREAVWWKVLHGPVLAITEHKSSTCTKLSQLMILDSHSLLRPLNFQFFPLFCRFAYFFPVIRKYCEFPIPSYISIPIIGRCRLQVAGCRGNIMLASNQLDEVALPRHLFGNNHHLQPTHRPPHATPPTTHNACPLTRKVAF